MKKEHILSEIERTAKENDGVPLGIGRFREATGIRREDWYGIHWARWSDAQKEAGFEPNLFSLPAFNEEWMINKIIHLTRELEHFPTRPECRIRRQADKNFPNVTTIRNRLGTKAEVVQTVLEYCKSHSGFQDIIDICSPLIDSLKKQVDARKNQDEIEDIKTGYVYMLKHGNRNEYKIGKTFRLIRREGEIRLELPEEPRPIHTIETDDPSGVEAYWHNRFGKNRMRNEWFKLDASDVKAFKRWRKIF